MKIADIKNRLHEKQALKLMSYSQYNPTLEKLTMLAEKYSRELTTSALGFVVKDVILGLIIVRCVGTDIFEILNLAVVPQLRNRGIGSQLIAAVRRHFPNSTIIAETDDESVYFYAYCGFEVEPLGEKYPGIQRYKCTYPSDKRES